MAKYEASYLHGLHDPGGESPMADRPGWIVHAISLLETQSMDYRYLTDRGFGVICRLNWGWNPHGTIPHKSQFMDMASLCRNFVANSSGCNYWIVGNEFNRLEEGFNNTPISEEDAAECHGLCYDAIKSVNRESKVLVAAIAPWDNRQGDWLQYQRQLVYLIDSKCDGYALHAYTHGSNPQLVYSLDEVHGWYWHFSTYLQQIRNIIKGKSEAKNREFHITEANQGDEAWVDTNSGWIKNAISFVHSNNQQSHDLRVRSVSFYRWKNYPHDKWGMEHKNGVRDDFRSAVTLAYPSPLPIKSLSSQVVLPIVHGGQNLNTAPSGSDLPWDSRLTDRGVSIVEASVKPGDWFWKLRKALWLNESEAGGRHHIYVSAFDEQGRLVGDIPFKVVWPTLKNPEKESIQNTKIGTSINGGNFPMSGSLNEYSVWIHDGKPSDILTGIGMGQDGNKNIHTSTVVEWILTRKKGNSTTETPREIAYIIVPSGAYIRTEPNTRGGEDTILVGVPYGAKVEILERDNVSGWNRVEYGSYEGWMFGELVGSSLPQPIPSPPPVPQIPPPTSVPLPTGDNWSRVRAFTRRWEGGFQNFNWDAGNWTGCEVGKGENRGTNFGISSCSYPHLDIKNLREEEADAIYFRDYWQASGADKLSWPLCLLVFDTAVNFHPTTAKKWLQESGSNPLNFVALRLRGYRKSRAWPQAGNAWVDRIIDIMLEASKP